MNLHNRDTLDIAVGSQSHRGFESLRHLYGPSGRPVRIMSQFTSTTVRLVHGKYHQVLVAIVSEIKVVRDRDAVEFPVRNRGRA
eukprot:scaffold44483_cov191-Amphora_coffeaeformis.AAC.4